MNKGTPPPGNGMSMKVGLQLTLLAAICFCAFFAHLGAHDVDIMEARNFVTAREMAVSGNWLVPTLNGALRIAKPPLPTWITAAARIAGGDIDDNALMRLPAALAACLMVLALWGLVRVIAKDRLMPFMCAAVLATCMLIIDNGRRGSWDIYCHSFMLTAVWALTYGWEKAPAWAWSFVAAGLFMAFSFMSKGPVAFYALLLPFIISYAVYGDRRRIFGHWPWLVLSLLLAVAISAAWPLYIYCTHPQAVGMAAAAETAAWANRHVRPVYFYLSFPFYAGIWALFAVVGLYRPYARNRLTDSGRYGFLLLWILIGLLLLSIIPEKKERYLMPLMIPLSIVIGGLFRSLMWIFQSGTAQNSDNRLLAAHTTFIGVISLCAPAALFYYGHGNGLLTAAGAAVWSIPFVFIFGSTVACGRQKRVGGLFGLSIVLVCLITLSMPPVIYRSPIFRNNPEYRSLRHLRTLKVVNALNCYHIGEINPVVVWNVGKPIKTIPSDGGSLPLDDLPFVLMSNENLLDHISASIIDRLKVTPMGKFKYDPRKSSKEKWVALIQRADNNRQAH